MNKSDITRDHPMLKGPLARRGYDWWWHSFTGINKQTGAEKAFFIEFFTCNPALAEDQPVLGQLPANQAAGKVPSYLMVKAGRWGEDARQLHRFFAWKDVKLTWNGPLEIKAGDCFLSETETRGSVAISEEEARTHPEYMCGSGSMSWDLKIKKVVAFHVGYGASRIFRKLNAFEMFWHAEGMKTLYEGTVVCDGIEYAVTPETCFGYADKNWGGDFTSPWVWISSCNLTSLRTGKKLENSVFNIGGGRPKVFGVALSRKLLSDFWYEGTSYEFNFSKFWTFTRTRFGWDETEEEIIWHVRQETLRAVMETDVRCRKNDMLLIRYEAPNGKHLHNRLWNGGNGTGTVRLFRKEKGELILVDEVEAANIGCEYGEYC